MVADINVKDLKGLIPSLPKGSSKSQDTFYKIAMIIILAVIVYSLYQIYKGYRTAIETPEKIISAIADVPKQLDIAATGLLIDSLAPYESQLSVERRLTQLTPAESFLVKTGTFITGGISPTLGAVARDLSLTEAAKTAIQPQLVTTESGAQMLITRTATFDELNPISKALVGFGNLITGGAASQLGENLKSYFQW